MFDRDRILALLDRSEPGRSLPRPFYRDLDVYEFDVERLFPRTWLMLGFEAELPEPGSYLSTHDRDDTDSLGERSRRCDSRTPQYLSAPWIADLCGRSWTQQQDHLSLSQVDL
jgi:hypothetical protein